MALHLLRCGTNSTVQRPVSQESCLHELLVPSYFRHMQNPFPILTLRSAHVPAHVFPREASARKGRARSKCQPTAQTDRGSGGWQKGGAGMALGAPQRGFDHSTTQHRWPPAALPMRGPLGPSPPLSPASGLGDRGHDLCLFSCQRNRVSLEIVQRVSETTNRMGCQGPGLPFSFKAKRQALLCTCALCDHTHVGMCARGCEQCARLGVHPHGRGGWVCTFMCGGGTGVLVGVHRYDCVACACESSGAAGGDLCVPCSVTLGRHQISPKTSAEQLFPKTPQERHPAPIPSAARGEQPAQALGCAG